MKRIINLPVINQIPVDNFWKNDITKNPELKTKFCETAVILHDSVFIKKYIDFTVNNYKIIINFCKIIFFNHSLEGEYSFYFNILSRLPEGCKLNTWIYRIIRLQRFLSMTKK